MPSDATTRIARLHGHDVAGVAPSATDEGEDVRDLLVRQQHRRHHAVVYLAVHDHLAGLAFDHTADGARFVHHEKVGGARLEA